MKNRIETVLEAQEQALVRVEAARAAAGRRLDAARTAARELEQRNAERSLRTVRRYETRCSAELDTQIRQLEARAQQNRDRFMLAAEQRLDGVIEKALEEIWPR
jgi:hypothetical protein